MKKRGDHSKNVIWLGITSFFTDVSSEMIFPILPIFLTSDLGASMAILGIIEGVAESLASILKLISGWLSDKLGKRKSLVVLGYAVSTLSKPLLAVSTVWGHVLGVRVADRIGKGVRDAPRDALIALSVKKRRGHFFGLHKLFDTSGAIVGVVIATFILGYIATGETAYRWIFLLSIIPGLIALYILMIKVKDVKIKKAHEVKFPLNNFHPNFKKFLVIAFIFSLANFSYAFFILRASDIGLTIALIPIVYLVYNIIYAIHSVPFGNLADKIGKKTVLTIGYLLFGATCFGFAFYANVKTIWLLFAFYGLFMAINEGVSRAYVSELVPLQKEGTALGGYHLIVGLAVLPANFIGGVLWHVIDVKAAFIYASILAVVAALFLIIFVRKRKR